MTPGHALLIVVVSAMFIVIVALLFAEPLLERRKRNRRTVEPAVPAEPIKLPITPALRAMRKRQANVVWNLDDAVIADKLRLLDAECLDLQDLADEVLAKGADR